MLRHPLLFLALGIAFGFFFATQSLPAQRPASPRKALSAAPNAIKSILASQLSKHAHELASEAYEGRLTGMPGQRKAERYFIEHFEKYGFEPYGDERSGSQGEKGGRGWLQAYDIQLQGLRAKTSGLFDSRKKLIVERGAWFVGKPEQLDVEARLMMVGEVSGGVGDLDLQGILPVFCMELDAGRGRGGMGRGFQLGQVVQAKLRGLAKQVKAAGGEAVIVLTEEIPASMLSVMMYMGLVTPGRPNVQLGHEEKKQNRRFRIAGNPDVPCVLISGDEARAVLAQLGMRRTPLSKASQRRGKKSQRKLRLSIDPQIEKTQAHNVVALLRGSDPELSKEALLYSCHMDHLGLAADGRMFHGADDNGSGCATVLEMAEAFSKLQAEDRPKRSILFLVVSGEELGLWGSGHFADHPTWPLQDIVANINMDMIGRSTKKVPEDMIALTPTHGHASYNELARDAAFLGKAFGLRMGNGDRFFQRSDQYNFAKKGIPVMFFCDDEHPDYHQVTDTPDKLEYDKLERVARLSWLIGYRWTMRPERPEKLGRRPSWFAQ
jgi:hypothetical protein